MYKIFETMDRPSVQAVRRLRGGGLREFGMSNDSEPGANGGPRIKPFGGKLRIGDPLPSLLFGAVAIPILLAIIAVAVSMQ
jgi:hypothetical protein